MCPRRRRLEDITILRVDINNRTFHCRPSKTIICAGTEAYLQLVGFSEDAERCGTTSSTTRPESPTIARVLPVLLNTICRTLNSTSGFIFTDCNTTTESLTFQNHDRIKNPKPCVSLCGSVSFCLKPKGSRLQTLKSFLERREAELEVLPLREESEC
jgi:hypothetical protein